MISDPKPDYKDSTPDLLVPKMMDLKTQHEIRKA